MKELNIKTLESSKKIVFIITGIDNYTRPGCERPRGGEFAADDCWLDGYHEDNEIRPS